MHRVGLQSVDSVPGAPQRHGALGPNLEPVEVNRDDRQDSRLRLGLSRQQYLGRLGTQMGAAVPLEVVLTHAPVLKVDLIRVWFRGVAVGARRLLLLLSTARTERRSPRVERADVHLCWRL